MDVGVVSSQTLFREALSACLLHAGTLPAALEISALLDPCTHNSTPPPQLVVIHAVDEEQALSDLRSLRDRHPDIRALLVTENREDEFCLRAHEAGAWGCLSTEDDPHLLAKALEHIARGQRWAGHGLLNLAIEKLIAMRPPEENFRDLLTPREWEVLSILAQGCSDKEIAGQLFISIDTAKSHLKSVYKKLQVTNRSAAAVYYFRHTRPHADAPPLA